jgi:large subunit ribosomal protein L18e
MKSNLQLVGLVRELKKHSNKEKAPIWKRIASDLEKPTRQRRVVNLSRINRFSKENDSVIVPGKVLGTGELNHKITIAAFTYSKQAVEKLKKSNCDIYSIYDFMKKNPQGKKTRILG